MSGPHPGPQRPAPGTPPRVPGSARRTTSIDVSRPEGLRGPAVVDVRGQDVRTGEGADAGTGDAGRVVDRLAATLQVDQRTGEVVAVTTSAGPPLDALVGVSVRSGYGRQLAGLFADEAARRSLLYSALDDLGGAFLVSGYALLRSGAIAADVGRGEATALGQADVCIGWATGSPLLESLRRDGVSATPYGPGAPGVDTDDPHGWHPMAPLAVGSVRRRRRLDVSAGATPELAVNSHFRDSYAAEDGEMVMHEYLVDAGVDQDRRIARVTVDPRVLPWRECPGAVASAQRLVGVAVDDVATRARRELTGPSTCTHLTSTLRCVADVAALAPT